jgi:hypothetical protein
MTLIGQAAWFIAVFLFMNQPTPLLAVDELKAYAGPVIGDDLIFPTKREPFGYAKASKMLTSLHLQEGVQALASVVRSR